MTREEIQKIVRDFVYGRQTLTEFAIQIHDAALEEAALGFVDDVTPYGYADIIRALKIGGPEKVLTP